MKMYGMILTMGTCDGMEGCRLITTEGRDGSIEKFKTRLVVIGCKQIKGVHFFYTYSFVSKVTTIRVLIAFVCVFNLENH